MDASWRSNRLLSVVVLGFDRLELLLFHGELPERLDRLSMLVTRPILLHQVADLVILARIRATKAFFSLAHHARIWICNVTRGQLHLLLLEFVERFHRALLSICQRHFIALQKLITETVFPPAIWRRWQVITLVALILLEEFLLVY